ncbi:MAG: NTP transferase domain-containing protein [Caulobacteraceae bacterium]
MTPLRVALPSAAGYVGALGSRRRLPERLARLSADGLSESAVARLKAPIGLNIGARAPWEIAVSVIAEAIQSLKAPRCGARLALGFSGGVTGVHAPIHAIVLAAGSGSRFGGGKLMAPWRGGVLLDGALDAAFAAPVQAVHVVVGADPRAAAHAQARGALIVEAADHALGLSASLKAGIAALPQDAAGVLVFLGDMPLAPHAVLASLAAAIEAGAPAAVPTFDGRIAIRRLYRPGCSPKSWRSTAIAGQGACSKGWARPWSSSLRPTPGCSTTSTVPKIFIRVSFRPEPWWAI